MKMINLATVMLLVFQVGCLNYTLKKNVVYKTVNGLDLKGDIYQPQTSGLKPAVVVVHGGWWARRSGEMEGICKDLVRAGFVAFNITYRLAPQSQYPKSVEDVRDSIIWLKANAQKFEIDSTKISAWGYSAGAHLILLVGLDPELGLKSLVAGGTPADLTAWPHSPMVFDFLGSTFADKPDLWREASPVNHVRENSPPVFLYHGAWDEVVEAVQVDKMTAALTAKKVHVESYKVPFFGHVVTYLFSQKSIDLGIQFIKENSFANGK